MTLHDEIETFVIINNTRYLNAKPPHSPKLILEKVEQLVEQVLKENQHEFFICKNIFGIFERLLIIYRDVNDEVLLTLLEILSILISNIPDHVFFNRLVESTNFRTFFECDFNFQSNDEILDYFVNLSKSIVLRINETTKVEPLFPIFQKIVENSNFKDNLTQTTIRNILLSCLSVENSELQILMTTFSILTFFLNLMRAVVNSIKTWDRLIIQEKESELKHSVEFVIESFQFMEECFSHARSSSVSNFIENLIFIFIVLQIIIPGFGGIITVGKRRFYGINSVLFVFYQLIKLKKMISISNFLFNSQWFSVYDCGCINTFKNTDLWLEAPIPEIAILPILEDMKLKSYSSEKAKLEIQNQIRMVSIWRLLKSKDDNMILLTTNILIEFYTQHPIYVDKNIISFIDNELIESCLHFRLITMLFFFKLLVILSKQHNSFRGFLKNILHSNFTAIIEQLRQALKNEENSLIIISCYRKLALQVETPSYLEAETSGELNWFSLYLYKYSDETSRYLRYKAKSYITNQSRDEKIEKLLKQLLILKNVTREINNDDNENSEKDDVSLSKLYRIRQKQSLKGKLKIKEIITKELKKHSDLKKILGGFILVNNSQQKANLYEHNGKLLLIVKSKEGHLIFFKERFCDVIVKKNELKSGRLHFSSRKSGSSFDLIYFNPQNCSQALEIIEVELRALLKSEQQFIEFYLNALERSHLK